MMLCRPRRQKYVITETEAEELGGNGDSNIGDARRCKITTMAKAEIQVHGNDRG